MDIISSLINETDKFLLILSRFAGIGLVPVFNARNIPAVWKVALALLLSSIAWNLGLVDNYQIPDMPPRYFLLLVQEVLIGITLALASQFFFAAIQLAGQVIDTQMGFGIMNVVDPLSGFQAPLLGNFKYILAMLVFLQIDGHHLFLQAFFDTYASIPIGGLVVSEKLIQSLVLYFGKIFSTGMKLALPIVASLLVTDLIMGIISRTVPQMNIFMVGMPAKIVLGFGVLLAAVPLYIYLLTSLLETMLGEVYQLLRIMA